MLGISRDTKGVRYIKGHKSCYVYQGTQKVLGISMDTKGVRYIKGYKRC